MDLKDKFPDYPVFRSTGWKGDSMILQLIGDVRVNTSKGSVTIPDGFITDGLSIPRIFWGIVGATTGKGFIAGLLHDYLYSKASSLNYSNFTRKMADDVFLESMKALGVPLIQRYTIYTAVRMFGWRFHKDK